MSHQHQLHNLLLISASSLSASGRPEHPLVLMTFYKLLRHKERAEVSRSFVGETDSFNKNHQVSGIHASAINQAQGGSEGRKGIPG